MSIADVGAIVGIGETAYTRGSGKSATALQMEAALVAIADAGITPRDIDGIVTCSTGPVVAEDFVTNFGIPDLRLSAHVRMGGASCVAALQTAVAAIAVGSCRYVLIPVGRNGYSEVRTDARMKEMPQLDVVAEFEGPVGSLAPVQYYAVMARRHMELYGTTSRQLGRIAVASRRHAALNPRALMTAPMRIEDHQQSRMISDPLRLLDCCIESDGGAAIVVTSADLARKTQSRPAVIMAVAEGHPDSPSAITQRSDMTVLGIAKAAPRAYEMAGLGPGDIDVAELYDCFTYSVLCQLDDVGYCRKGEGGAFVDSGAIELGGRLPVNTHGGLLSQAHVSGMNHVVELVRQLRGIAGAAQVPDARIGMVTGYGDLGDGSIAILRRWA